MKIGRTPPEMPAHLLAPLQMSVMACRTGPCAGLSQLQADLDAPTHEAGTVVYTNMIYLSSFNFEICVKPDSRYRARPCTF